ncbi:MAG: dihydrolipoamide acetyltransferase family protein [Planctomycetota bacterium]|jgi:pyruvate dehydrogenase E2 component (dihydrolipoamide acetyltransferase)
MTTRLDLPYLGEPVQHGILQRWFKELGEEVKEGEVLAEVSADKASCLLESPTSGVLLAQLAKPGDLVPVESALGVLGQAGEGIPSNLDGVRYHPAPADACLMYRESIDSPTPKQPPETLSPMRMVIADRMTKSKQQAPHFYVTTEVDMTACIELRKRLKREAKARVSYNDMILKASALALGRYPQVAALYSDAGYIHRTRRNVGFAVAVEPDGLVVPVIRDTDKLPLVEVAKKAKSLADLARKRKLTPVDFTGGVFTVSNLGSFDVDSFIAIVNPGESAILAIGKVSDQPTVVDGEIGIRPMMKMTLSSDHRVIDGVLAAKFNGTVKQLLENPDELLSGQMMGG